MAKTKKPISSVTDSCAGPTPVPKGYNRTEPGIIGMNADQMVAYNIAKSFCNVYPEVFNLPLLAKKLNITAEEAGTRIRRMLAKHEIMLVNNPQVNVSGYGLFYWVVKLKADASPEARAALTKCFQENDQICTGYPMMSGGEFDYFNGNHMRNLDNLISGVLDKFRYRDCIEWVHLCPIRRLIRESHVNQFDCHADFRHYFFPAEQVTKLCRMQKEMDAIDFGIIETLNNYEHPHEMFDVSVLARLSGLDADKMAKDFDYTVEQVRCQVPMIYFNYASLGLKMRFFLVDFFPSTLTDAGEQVIDELASRPEWVNIFDFGDAQHNIILSAYDDLNDMDELRQLIRSHSEVMSIREAVSDHQFRRWTCRLDADSGMWEECVMTDDLFVDRTLEDDFSHIVASREEDTSR